MNDKTAVINKIINDAQAAAGQLINEAKAKAVGIISAAQKSAAAYKERSLAGGEERAAAALERGRSVDALDTRRNLSACKSALIDEVFSAAAKALKEDKKAYKDYLTRVIKASAEDGDEVIICKEDEKTITPAFISSVAKSCKKKIKLSVERGEFIGGVILSGSRYDKNLTLEEDMRLIREECEPLVVKALFKGE